VTRILGISGSLRRGSFNTALLYAAQPLAKADVELQVATLHGIPLYDGDLEEREGLPPRWPSSRSGSWPATAC